MMLSIIKSYRDTRLDGGGGGREGVVSTAKPGHRLQQQTASERRERQI